MGLIQEYTKAQYRKYLEGYRAMGVRIQGTCLHHCWSPNASNWVSSRAAAIMQGIRGAHIKRGGSEIFCNAYTTPDGTVFSGRPPSWPNCACQAPPKSVDLSDLPLELRRLIAADDIYWRSWPNKFLFSIETVGNFDRAHSGAPPSEDPATSVAMATSLDLLAMVHDIWNIPVAHCFFHRDLVDPDGEGPRSPEKSCPGERVTKAWVHAQLARRLGEGAAQEVATILLPSTRIECAARLSENVTRCGLRAFVEGLRDGWRAVDRLKAEGRVYVIRGGRALPTLTGVAGAEVEVVVCDPEPVVAQGVDARLADGTVRCNMRAMAQALGGWQVHDHIPDQGKVYVGRV
jgi:hypothetical protein